MAKPRDQHRVNEEITIPRVRLINEEGVQVGIVPIEQARELAQEAGLDLVEIAPNSDPPVCKIMDYGRFKFEQSKKAQQARKRQKQIQVKEVKFRPGTDVGDYQVKLRNLRRFLEEGDRVKVTLRFRGREMAHQELGLKLLERVRDDLADLGNVEQFPKLEGRQMVMILSPKKK
ncbi:MAG: translation initiation factor IF-3 [Gammaproteobacteria bacterium]|nr:MAG: translation initiation factor IF-3 [Gammaproteobacteria bacterium]